MHLQVSECTGGHDPPVPLSAHYSLLYNIEIIRTWLGFEWAANLSSASSRMVSRHEAGEMG